MSAAIRLPGIRIDASPPPTIEGLPPMDVAVFVGFAARGPVHRPVAVHGVAQYQAIFGGDLALAFDRQRGEPVHAHLGPTVRSFFANGGRRCWVIRVARTRELEQAWNQTFGRVPALAEIAAANRFPVPGVLALVTLEDEPTPAMVQARSLGAWSDALRLSTALLAMGFRVLECAAIDPPAARRIRFCSATPLYPGDLIDLGSGGTPAATRLFARVDTCAADGSICEVQASLCAAFEPLTPDSESPPEASPPGFGDAQVCGLNSSPVPAELLPAETTQGTTPVARLRFMDASPDGLAVGQWVRWSADEDGYWLRIDRRLEQTGGLLVEGPAWRQCPPILPHPVPTLAARLTLDLRVEDESGAVHRLTGVGLTPDHPKAWWQWLDDDSHYDRVADRSNDRVGGSPVRGDTFPLAASADEIAAPPTWIPLGVEALFGPAQGPLPHVASRLERDGLARFDAELFLDPELAEVTIERLLERTEYLRFMASAQRRPYGIHAALTIGTAALFNEASLIAVPDAVHPGWIRRPTEDLPTAQQGQTPPAHWLDHRGPCAPRAEGQLQHGPDFSRFLDCKTRCLEAPLLCSHPAPVPCGAITLRWASTEVDATFLAEESRTGDFDDARTCYRGPADKTSVLAEREGIYYYRVSACAGAERSLPSEPITILVRDTDWVVRSADDAGAPGAPDPAIAELLRIHHGLLRLVTAITELFAVLSLPRRFRAQEAIAYAAQLRARLVSAGSGDGLQGRRALSFGAIYHPWLQLAQPVPPVAGPNPGTAMARPTTGPAYRACPPDGAVTGVLAERALQRGVWVAPANESLTGLIALTPGIDPADWLSLQQAHINLIRAEARGFLVLAAETLSEDDDWRAINVRRLFSLLRRLAMRRGLSYVFEPNGDLLRRAVERGFTSLLSDLFRRGAFAGPSAEQSFRVVTGGAVNTPPDGDQGRFLVELRVAPALPLRFLGLRLLQHGEQLTLLEGV